MAHNALTNTSSHPPIWRWTRSQLGAPPPPEGQREAPLRVVRFPSWRSAKRHLWAELWYQGGSEGNVRVTARGWTFDFPYDVAVGDVIAVLNGQPPRSL